MLTDIIVIGAFIAFAVLGYVRGFTRSVVSLIRISISVIIAFLLGSPIARIFNNWGLGQTFSNWFNTSAANGGYITTALVTIIIFIILRLVLHKFVKLADKAQEKGNVIGVLDRWLGVVFGVLRFVFLFSILAVVFRLITLLPFVSALHGTVFNGSVVALWLYNLIVKTIFAGALAAATQLLGN
jgi:uncharacterized membrane protein required for colicin V production